MTCSHFIPETLAVIAYLAAQTPEAPDPSDDLSLFLLLMLLAALAVCCFLLAAGAILAVVTVGFTSIFVALGIVSSSVVFGLLRQRVSAGVRALHYQTCAVLAAPAGVIVLWLASAWFNPGMRWRSILPLGALAGGSAGLIVAGIGDWAARLVCRRLLPARGTDAVPAVPLPG